MKIYGIDAPEFAEFGKVLEGYDTAPLLDALNKSTPLPDGTAYVAEEPALQSLDAAKALAPSLYGGLPYREGASAFAASRDWLPPCTADCRCSSDGATGITRN